MSSDEYDVQERRVERYFPCDREANKPHKILIGNNAFSSFHDETMEDVEEGAVVSFDFETNGQFNNIVKDSLVVHEEAEPEDEDGDGGTASETPTDARIRRQVALKAAAENEPDGAPVKKVLDRAGAYNDWLKGGDDGE